jgi:hypothetical protein
MTMGQKIEMVVDDLFGEWWKERTGGYYGVIVITSS